MIYKSRLGFLPTVCTFIGGAHNHENKKIVIMPPASPSFPTHKGTQRIQKTTEKQILKLPDPFHHLEAPIEIRNKKGRSDPATRLAFPSFLNPTGMQ